MEKLWKLQSGTDNSPDGAEQHKYTRVSASLLELGYRLLCRTKVTSGKPVISSLPHV